MTRHISVVLPLIDGQEVHFLHPDYSVARLLGYPLATNRLGGEDGIKVGGCGMDMGQHITYNLGRALWPEGFECIGEGCPANDHVNARNTHCAVCGRALEGEGSPLFSHYRGRHPVCSTECESKPWIHRDGGYALKHEWL